MTDYPTFGNKPLQHIPYTTRTTSIRTKPTDGRAKKKVITGLYSPLHTTTTFFENYTEALPKL